VRVFILVVLAALIVALGGLEVVSSRHLRADQLPTPLESPPGYWR